MSQLAAVLICVALISSVSSSVLDAVDGTHVLRADRLGMALTHVRSLVVV